MARVTLQSREICGRLGQPTATAIRTGDAFWALSGQVLRNLLSDRSRIRQYCFRGPVTLKLIAFCASLATLAGGFLSPVRPDSTLDDHTAALQAAKSLTVTFTTMRDGAKTEGTLTYSKPAMYRIETASRLTVSDGKTVWDLNKKDNTYTEGDAKLSRAMDDDVWVWVAFFSKDAFKEATNVTTGSKHNLKGVAVQDVSMDFPKSRSATLFLDAAAGYARGGSIKTKDVETIIVATDVKVGSDPAPDSTFAFVAPAGAKKLDKPAVADVVYADVDKIFQARCMPCHGTANMRGGLDLTSYQKLMAGGGSGPAIVPGDPDKSYLIQTLKGTASPQMPKGGGPLSAETIKVIEDWVKAGAKG